MNSPAPHTPAASLHQEEIGGSLPWVKFALVGGVAGLLWLANVAVFHTLRWAAGLDVVTGLVFPATLPSAVWMWPRAWGIATVLLGTLAIAALTAALLAFSARTGARASRGRTWLFVILAGTLVGLATDFARLLGFGPIPGVGEGLRGQLSIATLGASAMAGAYWAVLYGWIPALLLGRRRAGANGPHAGADAAQADPDHHAARPARRGFVAPVVTLVAAVTLLAVYVTVSAQGARVHTDVTQAELLAAEDAALIEAGTPRTGAAPDPEAEGDPVPAAAEASGARDASWCARDAITMMLPGADAGLGHRVATLFAVNVSDAACVLEGYPDIAFGDQNGHLLDVTVEQGDSFMARDAGASPITLQPGKTAVAYLGWNANSTQGALVAAEVHAAPIAGDARDTWRDFPAPFDLVPGSTAAVTAWEPAPAEVSVD